MFTGLAEEIGTIRAIDTGHSGWNIKIRAPLVSSDLRLGDSVAVNGACLTVVHRDSDGFTADAVPETMRRTNLSSLRPGSLVNLERAVRVGDRLGGHIVAGHVDGVGRVSQVAPEGIANVIKVEADASVLRYIVEKGSVCLDGVSLTVMDVLTDSFTVSIIPHTGLHTTLAEVGVGTRVNIECDVLGKYIEKLAFSPKRADERHESKINLDWLAQQGFV